MIKKPAFLVMITFWALCPMMSSAQTAEARAWLEVAQDYLNDSNPEQALQALDRFREINRRDIPQSYYLKAMSERSLNRLEGALATITAYKQSNQVSPRLAVHSYILALEHEVISLQKAEFEQVEEDRRNRIRGEFAKEVGRIGNDAEQAHQFYLKYSAQPFQTEANRLHVLLEDRVRLARLISYNEQQIRMNKNAADAHYYRRGIHDGGALALVVFGGVVGGVAGITTVGLVIELGVIEPMVAIPFVLGVVSFIAGQNREKNKKVEDYQRFLEMARKLEEQVHGFKARLSLIDHEASQLKNTITQKFMLE